MEVVGKGLGNLGGRGVGGGSAAKKNLPSGCKIK